jgi:hypothetical protein
MLWERVVENIILIMFMMFTTLCGGPNIARQLPGKRAPFLFQRLAFFNYVVSDFLTLISRQNSSEIHL